MEFTGHAEGKTFAVRVFTVAGTPELNVSSDPSDPEAYIVTSQCGL